MRTRITQQGLTVRAVGGTHVVMLGFNLAEGDCNGLMGFAIHRTDHTENNNYWLWATKSFAETEPPPTPGRKLSTRDHPIQSFQWADYSAKPAHSYTYKVVALTGTPTALVEHATCTVNVSTEDPEDAVHTAHFNRGVAASQEYARRFGNRTPEDAGPEAYTWLSRGLYEAMVGYIEAAQPGEHLYVCAYEFHFGPVLDKLREALDRGVLLHILYDHKQKYPGDTNADAVRVARLTDVAQERTTNPSYISHNKFIVHVRAGAAVSVLTGGTNFSSGGIFGHSNNLHIVRDADVATAYLDFWTELSGDPEARTLRPILDSRFPLPAMPPPVGTTVICSPRGSSAALDYYGQLALGAQQGLFMTFAFGMGAGFKEAYRNGTAPMRYALLEKPSAQTNAERREADIAEIIALRRMPENRFAIGSQLTKARFDVWMKEKLTGLNNHVRYLHTKYMLVDPLSDDPIVVSGSANFSEASTTKNDENMLIIRGDTRVADIYLGEFIRLYTHHAFREWVASQTEDDPEFKHLRTDDWWSGYYGDSERSHVREYFG